MLAGGSADVSGPKPWEREAGGTWEHGGQGAWATRQGGRVGRNHMGAFLGIGLFCLGCRHNLTPHVCVPKDRNEGKYFNFQRWNQRSRGSQAPRALLPGLPRRSAPEPPSPAGWAARVQRGRCLMGQDKLRACSPSQTFSTQPGLLRVGDTVSSRLLRLPPWKPSAGTSTTAYMTATFSLYQMRPRDPITAPTPAFQGALWTQALPGGRVHTISPHPAL